jgi:hypothetical protein
VVVVEGTNARDKVRLRQEEEEEEGKDDPTLTRFTYLRNNPRCSTSRTRSLLQEPSQKVLRWHVTRRKRSQRLRQLRRQRFNNNFNRTLMRYRLFPLLLLLLGLLLDWVNTKWRKEEGREDLKVGLERREMRRKKITNRILREVERGEEGDRVREDRRKLRGQRGRKGRY